jgi:hypothetical protein
MDELVWPVRREVMNAVSRKMRENVIQTLRLIADGEAQRRYQSQVPFVSIPHEMFNQWDDFFHPTFEDFRAAFSVNEFQALLRFQGVMDVLGTQCARILPPLDEFQKTGVWTALSKAASDALNVCERTTSNTTSFPGKMDS